MYINHITIKNVRSIESFEMSFDSEKQAGWHVLIGDNGAGKSTIVRSIALALIGPYDSKSLRLNLNEWLPKKQTEGTITLEIQRGKEDKPRDQRRPVEKPFRAEVKIKKNSTRTSPDIETNEKDKHSPRNYIWSNAEGWFSAAFGPFRRFTGGDKEWMKVYYSDPRAAAHLSVFGEDVALTEALDWMKNLNYKALETSPSNTSPERELLDCLKSFVNESGLLPHNTKLERISSEGVFFVDGNGLEIEVTQLSDGFRSVLSLTFELLRQMVRTYSQKKVFANFKKGQFVITMSGVVLIDEVDAHLHPTWQTRIGQWFTKVFPNIQFIVTTHSPLICRASENGSIWRLAAPGSDAVSGELEGVERDKLIYGNVLDAFGTEAFGKQVTRSKEANEMLDRLAELNNKSTFGVITYNEKKELQNLRKVLTTDDTTEY